MSLPPPITISDEAAAHLKRQFERADKPYAGLLISIANGKGCAQAEYAFKPIADDEFREDMEIIQDKDITLFVSRKDILFIFGSELILHQDQFATRLDFKNPNEDERCGCGESVSFKIPKP